MNNSVTEVKLAKSVTLIFFTTFIHWFLACIRIVIVAFIFGATFVYDAYLIAFTIPEMITGLLVGIISVTFIPIFSDYLFKDGEIKALNFAFGLINILFIIGLLLTIIMILIAPFIIKIAAPGFNPETFQLAVRLMIIIIPIVLIISLAELVTRMLHVYQYFVIPALCRILEAIVIIICLIFLHKKYGIFSLAYGLLFGSIVRLVFQVPFLGKKIKYYRLSCNFRLAGIKKIVLLSGLLISGMVFFRIGKLIERILASTLKEGSISILGYASALIEAPVEIIIGSLGVVLFPLISKYFAEKKMEDFKVILLKGIQISNFILFPIAVLFIFFGRQIIKSFLERGQFISSTTQDTSIALAVYALGLFAISFDFFSTHACFALQEVKATVKVSVFAMIINIILKLILINYLSFVGLALATSIALMIQSGILVGFIRKKIGPFIGKKTFLSSLKILMVSMLMAGTCWIVLKLIPSDMHNLIHLAILIISAMVSYFGFSYLFQSQELKAFRGLLKKMIVPSV